MKVTSLIARLEEKASMYRVRRHMRASFAKAYCMEKVERSEKVTNFKGNLRAVIRRMDL